MDLMHIICEPHIRRNNKVNNLIHKLQLAIYDGDSLQVAFILTELDQLGYKVVPIETQDTYVDA